MENRTAIKSVAVIGAGAAGAITTAALVRENVFETIRVFERRRSPGGTWIYDANPTPPLDIFPGALPKDVDPPLPLPSKLPATLKPSQQERFEKTPIYDSLTTNVPDIAMSFSDIPFGDGPFVGHEVPCRYVKEYFGKHGLRDLLVLGTTVEDVSVIRDSGRGEGRERWKLTLRRFDEGKGVDEWWEEEFDAVIFGNGHYSVPFIPEVKGLKEYSTLYPGRVMHSKYYRSPKPYTDKKVLIIGNSASGHDLSTELVTHAKLPVYLSIRSKSRWDGPNPPPGISWLPIITTFHSNGSIEFADGTILTLTDIDRVIYCTGYRHSFPFWNVKNNGRLLWDETENKLIRNYWHTFLHDFPTVGVIGVPRVLTFRSWEYQAITLARLFAGRLSKPLPGIGEMERWERERSQVVKREGRKFHDIVWEVGGGETLEWLEGLFEWAGLGTLEGDGRLPPTLGRDVIWAIEHVRKYPEPGKDGMEAEEEEGEWVVVDGVRKDLLHFI